MRRRVLFAAVVTCAAALLVGCIPTPSEPVPPPTTETPTPSPSEVTTPLTLYYVAIGGAGTFGEEIGCGDSLVAVTTEPVTTDDLLRSSIEALLDDDDRELGQSGYTNAVVGGTLAYVDGGINAGVVTVELTGEPAPLGTCDNPRIEQQLARTAIEATDATEAVILVDGEPIANVLSLR